MSKFNYYSSMYWSLFRRLLGKNQYTYFSGNGRLCNFLDDDGNKMKIVFGNNKIYVNKDQDGKKIVESIELPSKDFKYLKSREVITEQFENGVKVDDITRFYEKQADGDYHVSDIYQISTCSNENSEKVCNSFESHKRIKVENGKKIDSNATYYNNLDITKLYNNVTGPSRIEKIYDLYNGNISELIKFEMNLIGIGKLDNKCFDYKSYNGVKDLENNILLKNNKRFK